ncbi:tetratricopeptide repeat protein [bacterium]|nr:tetratricopeptide repeat protein [bacterium]
MKKYMLIPIFLALFSGCGSKSDLSLKKAREALDKRDFSKVIVELDPLRKSNDPVVPEVNYLMGRAYLGLKNLSEAEKNFKKALASDTLYRDSIALAYKKRGIELGKVGERELAIECFESAIRTSKRIYMGDAYSLMGDLYEKFGEYGKSVYYYRRSLASLKDSTSRAMAWEKLIILLEKLGDKGEAYQATEQAMQERHYYLEPRYCQNAYLYAEDLFQRGQLDSADLIMTRVLQVELSQMLKDDIYFLAGEIRLRKGDVEGAKAAFREVLKLSVNASAALASKARERLALLGEETN